MLVSTISTPVIGAPRLHGGIVTVLTFIGAAISATIMVVLGLDPENI